MFAYCGNNPVIFKDSSGASYFNIPDMISPLGDIYDKIISFINHIVNSRADADASKTTKNKIINDQYEATGNNFQYGLYNASWNGCEAIAVHNATILIGGESSLSNTILFFQTNGAMIGYGFFGSDPTLIGQVLDSQGIHYTSVGLDEMTQAGVYIISYWQGGAFRSCIHTVAVSYDGNTYTTYNLTGHGKTSDENPNEYANNFICGYYLGGAA